MEQTSASLLEDIFFVKKDIFIDIGMPIAASFAKGVGCRPVSVSGALRTLKAAAHAACDDAQGNYFGRPQPAAAFAAQWLGR